MEMEHDENQQLPTMHGPVRSISNSAPLRRLAVKSNGKITFVEIREIKYIEAEGNNLRIYTVQREFLTRERISAMETLVNGTDLIRVHRSTIVNRSHIQELRPWPTGEYVIVMSCGKELTLSRGFRSSLSQLLTLH